ncbi:MAG TPA: polyprenyl synthetase family protein [Dehalococcoidia bacterium]|nr:polyprenyl synthetase family protein [Dehalococcoidia bacterium]
MIDIENIFQRYRPELEAELKRIVGKASLPMYDMMRYHMGWIEEAGHTRRNTAGKRLRPILCLLACESLNGQWRQALPVAASVELVHNFSLIHDDIQDSSRERRGRPTVWSIWGLPQGINAGDGMHALALSSLLRLEERGVPHEKTVRAASILGEASLRLCEGQYLDLSYENRLDIKVKDYLAMISGKTAALFRSSLEIGSLMATEDESVITHMRTFGHALGMTFQVHDDVLSIWGDEKATGKPVASDIQMRKKTLPVVYALSKAKGEDRERLLRTYRKKRISYADVDEVLKLLDKVDARAYAQEMSTKYYNDALAELNGLDISQTARAELEAVAAFLFDRKF